LHGFANKDNARMNTTNPTLPKRPIRVMNILARMNIGGPTIHVALLTQKFGPPMYESLFVSGTIDPDEGDMEYFVRDCGVTPTIVPELGRSLNPLRDLLTVWKLYQLMRQWQPDIVHTNTAKAGFVGRVAAWLAGVKVIVHTFHGHVFRGYFTPWMTGVFLWLERLAARMSDTVITLTEGLRTELADVYRITRRSHITVLPYGFDLSAFTAMPRKQGAFRARFNLPSDRPLVGIVARLVPVKNHALFLQAAALVRQQMPEAYFVIVGDGELRAQVEAQIDALGLRPHITITGWVREMAQVYSDLDVKAISSVNEGTPITLIEALACGCPVVSTGVGGVPDFLENGALGKVTPSGDAAALATAILDTLRTPPDTEPLRQAMVERYGIDRLVRDLDSLYRGLLAKKQK
jgi:glycosyltransferase involved in cell wall biosynthesis